MEIALLCCLQAIVRQQDISLVTLIIYLDYFNFSFFFVLFVLIIFSRSQVLVAKVVTVITKMCMVLCIVMFNQQNKPPKIKTEKR